jgi:hypothetical protein
MTSHTARETWLQEAVKHMSPWFDDIQAMKVPAVRVSCGWTKRAARNSIGWCWHRETSADGTNEILISPELDDPVTVLHVLLHELIHASDNGESKHGGYFRATALALGLEGKMTATVPSYPLRVKLVLLSGTLGPYPHAAIDPAARTTGKQGTRMLKIVCPDDGYTLRTTQKWVDVGLPSCPCGAVMNLEVK